MRNGLQLEDGVMDIRLRIVVILMVDPSMKMDKMEAFSVVREMTEHNMLREANRLRKAKSER